MARENMGRWRRERLERPGGGRKPSSMTPGEKRRAAQLVVCLALFGMTFLGRGVSWGTASTVGGSLRELINSHTDFRAAFSQVGESLAQGEPVIQTFGVLWDGIFGEETSLPVENGPDQDPLEGEDSLLPAEDPVEPAPPPEPAEADPAPAQGEPAPAEPTLSPGEELVGGETVTPVLGILTSGFGPRTHPLDGEWKEHNGIDIQADLGTDILAFAAGEVDYIGESEAYGLYLQLTHANGITSFYAHCSEICVKTGQKVAAGETIAKVGDTGNVTGPHLHLEMKRNGTRVDPALYVETMTP